MLSLVKKSMSIGPLINEEKKMLVSNNKLEKEKPSPFHDCHV